MQHITVTLEDQDYQAFSREALRLNQSVDTYVSALLMAQIAEEGQEDIRMKDFDMNSPMHTGIGLFSDVPELMDAIVADAMANRSKPWRLPDDEKAA